MSSASETAASRRKRRIFLWFFLAVQAAFILWIIAGAASSSPPCVGHLSARDCAAAHDVGNGIAVVVQVIAWVVVDFLLAVTYGIYRLARRPR
jgi:uncharacterized membrane protein